MGSPWWTRGYFKTISYCMMGSGIVLLLQSLPVGIWWFGVLQVLIGSCIVGINPSLSAAVTSIPTQALEVGCLVWLRRLNNLALWLALYLPVLYLPMLAYPMYLVLQVCYCYIWHSNLENYLPSTNNAINDYSTRLCVEFYFERVDILIRIE